MPLEFGVDALWGDGAVSLSDSLRNSYQFALERSSLSGLADKPSPEKGEPGGADDESADRHFAWRFANSAGRGTFVCIDPLDQLGSSAGHLRKALLDGSVMIIDAPCGAGGGALGILSAVYEMRRARVLPTLPLQVKIVAADFSPRAMHHYAQMIEHFAPELRKACVFVDVEFQRWDVSNLLSSTELIDKAASHIGCVDRSVLLIANFSGALSDGGLRERFEHFFSQCVARLSAGPHLIFWVEPKTKDAASLLGKIGSWTERLLSGLVSSTAGSEISCQYDMIDPLTIKRYRSGVSIFRCEVGGASW